LGVFLKSSSEEGKRFRSLTEDGGEEWLLWVVGIEVGDNGAFGVVY